MASSGSPGSDAASWVRLYDPASGQYYYQHQGTFDTSWDPPAEWRAPDGASAAPSLAPEVGAAMRMQSTFRAQVARKAVRRERARTQRNVLATASDGWQKLFDPASQCDYYYNPATEQVSWTLPQVDEAGPVWISDTDPQTGNNYYFSTASCAAVWSVEESEQTRPLSEADAELQTLMAKALEDLRGSTPGAAVAKGSPWCKAFGENGRAYYYNVETFESVWELPDNFDEETSTQMLESTVKIQGLFRGKLARQEVPTKAESSVKEAPTDGAQANSQSATGTDDIPPLTHDQVEPGASPECETSQSTPDSTEINQSETAEPAERAETLATVETLVTAETPETTKMAEMTKSPKTTETIEASEANETESAGVKISSTETERIEAEKALTETTDMKTSPTKATQKETPETEACEKKATETEALETDKQGVSTKEPAAEARLSVSDCEAKAGSAANSGCDAPAPAATVAATNPDLSPENKSQSPDSQGKPGSESSASTSQFGEKNTQIETFVDETKAEGSSSESGEANKANTVDNSVEKESADRDMEAGIPSGPPMTEETKSKSSLTKDSDEPATHSTASAPDHEKPEAEKTKPREPAAGAAESKQAKIDETNSERSADERPADERPADERPADERPAEGENAGETESNKTAATESSIVEVGKTENVEEPSPTVGVATDADVSCDLSTEESARSALASQGDATETAPPKETAENEPSAGDSPSQANAQAQELPNESPNTIVEESSGTKSDGKDDAEKNSDNAPVMEGEQTSEQEPEGKPNLSTILAEASQPEGARVDVKQSDQNDNGSEEQAAPVAETGKGEKDPVAKAGTGENDQVVETGAREKQVAVAEAGKSESEIVIQAGKGGKEEAVAESSRDENGAIAEAGKGDNDAVAEASKGENDTVAEASQGESDTVATTQNAPSALACASDQEPDKTTAACAVRAAAPETSMSAKVVKSAESGLVPTAAGAMGKGEQGGEQEAPQTPRYSPVAGAPKLLAAGSQLSSTCRGDSLISESRPPATGFPVGGSFKGASYEPQKVRFGLGGSASAAQASSLDLRKSARTQSLASNSGESAGRRSSRRRLSKESSSSPGSGEKYRSGKRRRSSTLAAVDSDEGMEQAIEASQLSIDLCRHRLVELKQYCRKSESLFTKHDEPLVVRLRGVTQSTRVAELAIREASEAINKGRNAFQDRASGVDREMLLRLIQSATKASVFGEAQLAVAVRGFFSLHTMIQHEALRQFEQVNSTYQSEPATRTKEGGEARTECLALIRKTGFRIRHVGFFAHREFVTAESQAARFARVARRMKKATSGSDVSKAELANELEFEDYARAFAKTVAAVGRWESAEAAEEAGSAASEEGDLDVDLSLEYERQGVTSPWWPTNLETVNTCVALHKQVRAFEQIICVRKERLDEMREARLMLAEEANQRANESASRGLAYELECRRRFLALCQASWRRGLDMRREEREGTKKGSRRGSRRGDKKIIRAKKQAPLWDGQDEGDVRGRASASLVGESAHSTPWQAIAAVCTLDEFKRSVEQARQRRVHQEGKAFNLDAADRRTGRILLHVAAWYGRVDLVQCLLQLGANPDAVRSRLDTTTALHVAARARNSEMLRTLVRAGARVCAADSAGDTALHWACRSDSLPCVRVLLEAARERGALYELLGRTNRKSKTATELLPRQAAIPGASRFAPEIAELSYAGSRIYELLRGPEIEAQRRLLAGDLADDVADGLHGAGTPPSRAALLLHRASS